MGIIRLKKIGVFTSGGDSPGMNAAIRAVTRHSLYNNIEVTGIYRGYDGLIKKDFTPLNRNSVSDIIQRGGTILQSARSDEFRTKQGRAKAYDNLMEEGIDALVAIGGDGTFTGASIFIEEYDFPIVGLPGTIDNDLYGTDLTIGFDTAVNTVVQAVDKIRDTAHSHNRLFFVEVMGRDAGFIALRSGVAGGADNILVPETKTYIDNLIRLLKYDWKRKKTTGIIIVSEGDDEGGAYDIARKVKEKFAEFETRVTILGHIQRGGSPSATDRILASLLGFEAVNSLINGDYGIMLGMINNKVSYTPFEQAIKNEKDIDRHFLEIARILSL